MADPQVIAAMQATMEDMRQEVHMLRQNNADLATVQAGRMAQILELRGQSAAVAALSSLPDLGKNLVETQRTIAE